MLWVALSLLARIGVVFSLLARIGVALSLLARIGVALSLLERIGGECSTIHSRRELFCFSFFFLFFLKVEISSGTLIPLTCKDQSTLAQRAETTEDECSRTSRM